MVDKGREKKNYCLADFIAPKNDYLGMFAISAGHGLESYIKKFDMYDDDYNSIMAKIITDRLLPDVEKNTGIKLTETRSMYPAASYVVFIFLIKMQNILHYRKYLNENKR